jgi:hypothetical protein
MDREFNNLDNTEGQGRLIVDMNPLPAVQEFPDQLMAALLIHRRHYFAGDTTNVAKEEQRSREMVKATEPMLKSMKEQPDHWE